MGNEETGLTPTNKGVMSFETMMKQAEVLIASGFLSKSIDTPAKAVAIMMKGQEIGIPPMQALSQIDIIQGKPVANAELRLALIYKNCKGARVHIVERSDTRCEIVASRPGCGATAFSFTLDDAKRAGLLSKDNWQKYPKSMISARCISDMARAMFPDAIAGVSHTAEELGADVEEDGTVIVAEPATIDKQDGKPLSKYYTGTPEQISAIEKVLDGQAIPNEYRKTIQSKMFGRQGKDLPHVIREVIAQGVQQ